ncbi:MAG: molybdopterin-dependent oxidoreductase [Thermodesulfovibrionales bacterium]|jgi:DMSO/TMAO reductase YedYZ molybdopterin-dependent catalytic subunit
MDECFSRRKFFRGIGLGTIGLGFGVSVFDGIYEYAEAVTEAEEHALLLKGTVNFKGFTAKEITPNEDFYITTYSDKVPVIDPKTFGLRIEGLVEKPYTLSLSELEGMKDKTEFVTFECIGNPVGGDAISNALWDAEEDHREGGSREGDCEDGIFCRRWLQRQYSLFLVSLG